MSGLSNRVMTMKFMLKGDSKDSKQSKDANSSAKSSEGKKVKDSSEWVMPNSAKLIQKARVSPVVQSVGYSSVNLFSGSGSFGLDDDNEEDDEDMIQVKMPAARKTWGETTKIQQEGDDISPIIELGRIKDSVQDTDSRSKSDNNKNGSKKRSNESIKDNETSSTVQKKRRFTQT
ncbi:uncharacterized protein RJT20DRAFT_137353 [Scheffersomyces xylosifermentans]|uniref:uncharacterized protein n=1 Tax=Scheffersomyces xylosifermentans TaxID=1304137 RepID=UPI00315DB3E8